MCNIYGKIVILNTSARWLLWNCKCLGFDYTTFVEAKLFRFVVDKILIYEQRNATTGIKMNNDINLCILKNLLTLELRSQLPLQILIISIKVVQRMSEYMYDRFQNIYIKKGRRTKNVICVTFKKLSSLWCYIVVNDGNRNSFYIYMYLRESNLHD